MVLKIDDTQFKCDYDGVHNVLYYVYYDKRKEIKSLKKSTAENTFKAK